MIETPPIIINQDPPNLSTLLSLKTSFIPDRYMVRGEMGLVVMGSELLKFEYPFRLSNSRRFP